MAKLAASIHPSSKLNENKFENTENKYLCNIIWMQLSTSQYLLQSFINLPSLHAEGITSSAVSDIIGVYEQVNTNANAPDSVPILISRKLKSTATLIGP